MNQDTQGAQNSAPDLLPCPFCGSTNIDPAEWSGNDGASGPGCGDCGALADSAELWNRRATPAGREAPTDLHDAIMNLRCDASHYDSTPNERLAYKLGHRDARHAAASLALAAHPVEAIQPTDEQLIAAGWARASKRVHGSSPAAGGALVAMRDALKPFAAIADQYASQEDDGFPILSDYPHGALKSPTLGQCRAARDALAAPATGAQVAMPEKAAAPAERQAVLEEAAKVCDDYARAAMPEYRNDANGALCCARNIRALATQPTPPEGANK